MNSEETPKNKNKTVQDEELLIAKQLKLDNLKFKKFWDEMPHVYIDSREAAGHIVQFKNKVLTTRNKLQSKVINFYLASGVKKKTAVEEIKSINYYNDQVYRAKVISEIKKMPVPEKKTYAKTHRTDEHSRSKSKERKKKIVKTSNIEIPKVEISKLNNTNIQLGTPNLLSPSSGTQTQTFMKKTSSGAFDKPSCFITSLYKTGGAGTSNTTRNQTYLEMTKSYSTKNFRNNAKLIKNDCKHMLNLSNLIKEELKRKIQKLHEEDEKVKEKTFYNVGFSSSPKDIKALLLSDKEKVNLGVKMKTMLEGKTNKISVIKESTANIMSIGDCFFKIDDNLFYHTRKNFVKDYPRIQIDAGLGSKYVSPPKYEAKYLRNNILKMKQKIYNTGRYINKIMKKCSSTPLFENN